MPPKQQKTKKQTPLTRRGPQGPLLGMSEDPQVLAVCPVGQAVMMLQNNAVRVVEEKGSSRFTSVTYPPELVGTLRGMFRAGRTYDFEIHASQNMATTGAGAFGSSIDWSPAVSSFSEWSALSALFDEVVLRSSHLTITSAFGPTSTAIIFAIMIAPQEDNNTANSYSTVSRLAESEQYHPYIGGRSGSATFSKTHRVASRPYAATGTPAGATGTPAGCLGRWVYASNIVGTVSINYGFAAMWNIVRLRNRA